MAKKGQLFVLQLFCDGCIDKIKSLTNARTIDYNPCAKPTDMATPNDNPKDKYILNAAPADS